MNLKIIEEERDPEAEYKLVEKCYKTSDNAGGLAPMWE